VALALSRKRGRTVGLLTKDSCGRFTMPVMAGMAEAQVDEDISVFMSNIGDDASARQVHLDAMLDKQVNGIVLTRKRIDWRLPVNLSEVTIPVVYAFTEGPEGALSLVSSEAQGAFDAVVLPAGDFDHQVAKLQIRIAVLTGCTALGIPVTAAVG
jgi:LacI family transcriptional regulator